MQSHSEGLGVGLQQIRFGGHGSPTDTTIMFMIQTTENKINSSIRCGTNPRKACWGPLKGCHAASCLGLQPAFSVKSVPLSVGAPHSFQVQHVPNHPPQHSRVAVCALQPVPSNPCPFLLSLLGSLLVHTGECSLTSLRAASLRFPTSPAFFRAQQLWT